jgi:prophage antirepressor-like protein
VIIYHSFELKVTAMEENKVQTFNNAQFGRLRTLEIEGDSWFVGRDVAVALGYKDPAKAVREKVAVEDIAAKVLNTCAKSLRNSTFSREVPHGKHQIQLRPNP